MKEINENPYKANTPVVPFSNGTDFMVWHSNNCDRCVNYESESTSESEAKCKLAYNLDLCTISGDMPLWVAKAIGCTYNALYQTCKLDKKCRKFDDGRNEPF